MSFLNITDPEKRDFLVKEFLKSKQNIRLNSLSEKLGDIGLQRELTKLYKPITDSQTTQSATLTKELSATTTALKALPAVLKSSLTSQMIQFPSYPSIRAEEDKGPNESFIELGPIATEYLRSMTGKTPTDKIFGLYDKNGAFYIGDSEVTISGDDIIIGETEFTGTPGLWELITSKNPDSGIYNTDDLDNYETILLNTNAIVNPQTGRVKSSSSNKYRNIVKPIYDAHFRPRKKTSTTTGTGISLRQSPTYSMLMPSDLSVVADMLSLRFASYKAGNTGVRNEIVDLSDELLRRGVMSNDSYKKLMLLL